MNQAHRILTRRFGEDVRQPLLEDLQLAVDELFAPAYSRDEEHGQVCLRYLHDGGPMYVLAFTLHGKGYFSRWADTEFENLEEESEKTGFSPIEVRNLLERLQAGDTYAVKAAFR